MDCGMYQTGYQCLTLSFLQEKAEMIKENSLISKVSQSEIWQKSQQALINVDSYWYCGDFISLCNSWDCNSIFKAGKNMYA